jgi:hypothetical protein
MLFEAGCFPGAQILIVSEVRRLARRALFLFLFCTAAAFGAEQPTAVALRTQQQITLDGNLNEEAWQEVASIGPFTQREPDSGVPPTEQTEVRVLYDANFLYIGMRCFDSQPDSIMATQMQRDADLEQDDRIEILVDSFRDGRNAYYFATNPAGALVDGRITENQSPRLEWDAVWDLRIQTDNQGWTAEFQIPFRSIGFNRHTKTWGFNVSRTLARLREESRWTATSFDAKFYQVALAGALGEFEGLSQGVGIDVKPYGLTGFTRDVTQPDVVTGELTGGVDVFWRVTSNLISSTTINTDFAETEVDTRQVNLPGFHSSFQKNGASSSKTPASLTLPRASATGSSFRSSHGVSAW